MEDCGFGDFNIAIVGVGLIGGSYAMALKNLNTGCIIGVDNNLKTLHKALDMNIIDHGYDKPGEFLKNIDIIIVSLYPKDTVEFIRENMKYFETGVIITDTSGVKKVVVDSVDSFLPETFEFVAGHPMAGREYKGIEYADGSIFKDANYIITPGTKSNRKGIELITLMAQKLGCKNVECISPEEHDRIIAYTSQLPHAIATALLGSRMENVNSELFVGGSFKDSTRVAMINSKLWTELFVLNSKDLSDGIERFQKVLSRIKNDIDNKNTGDLAEMFEDAMIQAKKIH